MHYSPPHPTPHTLILAPGNTEDVKIPSTQAVPFPSFSLKLVPSSALHPPHTQIIVLISTTALDFAAKDLFFLFFILLTCEVPAYERSGAFHQAAGVGCTCKCPSLSCLPIYQSFGFCWMENDSCRELTREAATFFAARLCTSDVRLWGTLGLAQPYYTASQMSGCYSASYSWDVVLIVWGGATIYERRSWDCLAVQSFFCSWQSA